MPIYEYRCGSCGFQKEYLQKINDPVLTDCPGCGKSSFAKMLTAAGFQLKGSGWYATDFKGGGKPAAAPAAPAAEPNSKAAEPDSKAAASAHSCGAGACSTCS